MTEVPSLLEPVRVPVPETMLAAEVAPVHTSLRPFRRTFSGIAATTFPGLAVIVVAAIAAPLRARRQPRYPRRTGRRDVATSSSTPGRTPHE